MAGHESPRTTKLYDRGNDSPDNILDFVIATCYNIFPFCAHAQSIKMTVAIIAAGTNERPIFVA
jgi:hypothetical protein